MTDSRMRAAGLLVGGVLLCGAGHSSTFTTLASIQGSGDGGGALSAMINVGGTLYGTAPNAGSTGCGAVYAFNPATGQESVLYGFAGGSDGCTPKGSLLSVGGLLYGTTYSGGAAGTGTVFQVDPATGKESVIYAFAGGSDGAKPLASLISVKGTLYGTTTTGGQTNKGTVFSIDLATGAETVIYSFTGQGDGATPESALVAVKGLLYGTADAGGIDGDGTVFSINPSTGVLTTIYSFTNQGDGGGPAGGVVKAGNLLYGATTSGGEYSHGAVFGIDLKTGKETTVYAFPSSSGTDPQSPLLYSDGTLYGTTPYGGADYFGTLYSVDVATGTGSILHNFGANGDGANPAAAPVEVNGNLYGVTQTGGAAQVGIIYSYSLSAGTESIVHSFTGANNQESAGGITKVKTTLVAAVAQGGTSSQGEVLNISPASGAVTPVYSFSGANGVYPSVALLDYKGIFYGTTKQGGTSGYGTVFSYDPSSGTEKVIYSFSGGADGGTPYAGLVELDGALYGATLEGGADYYGTVFKVDLATGKETVVYNFTGGADGGEPFAGLVNVGGTLYGTTDRGGSTGYGVVFSVNPNTGAESALYNFTGGNDGGIPSSTLLNVGGLLYGVTIVGGTSGDGTVFSFNPATNAETVLHSFTGGTDGDGPDASLLKVGGNLYGTTSGELGGFGTIFKLDLAAGTETPIYNFTGGADGGNPNANLSYIGGKLYGMDATGGSANLGVVFSIKP